MQLVTVDNFINEAIIEGIKEGALLSIEHSNKKLEMDVAVKNAGGDSHSYLQEMLDRNINADLIMMEAEDDDELYDEDEEIYDDEDEEFEDDEFEDDLEDDEFEDDDYDDEFDEEDEEFDDEYMR